MANALAKLGFADADVSTAREVLQLPITEDVRLKILTRKGMIGESDEGQTACKKVAPPTTRRNPSRGGRSVSTPQNQDVDAMDGDGESNA